ncbi:hypothetical protein HK102_004971 [Quaeritorhiza haematococci]|nr:hypothetical protein HK102_004971 [Quaeritorhiza haematococci]
MISSYFFKRPSKVPVTTSTPPPSNSASAPEDVLAPAPAQDPKRTSDVVPITNPDGSLINLKDYLAQELTTEQQHLFIESAWMYLNRHDECCIDLEVAMQWMGVAKKGVQKAKLKEHFTEGIDYQVLLFDSGEAKTGRGGHNKETIMLTPDAFKKLGQMSEGRGREVREYFIAMERVVIKYMKMQNTFMTQQLLETRAQLEHQTRVLQAKEEELQHFKSKKYEEREHIGYCYVIQTDGGLKVGKTKDVGKRVKGLQTANANELRILLAFPTCEPDLVEKAVHLFLDRYRSNANREFFDCNPEYIKAVVELTGNFVNTMGSAYQAITRTEILKKFGEKFGSEMVTPATPEPKGPQYPHGPFRGFIQTHCESVPLDDESGWTPLKEFYQRFKAWCNENGFPEHGRLQENPIGKGFENLVHKKNMNRIGYKGKHVQGLRFIY